MKSASIKEVRGPMCRMWEEGNHVRPVTVTGRAKVCKQTRVRVPILPVGCASYSDQIQQGKETKELRSLQLQTQVISGLQRPSEILLWNINSCFSISRQPGFVS